MTEAQIAEQEKQTAQLQMLIGDRATSKSVKADTELEGIKDSRFAHAAKDNDFAVDPTHREYRKVA